MNYLPEVTDKRYLVHDEVETLTSRAGRQEQFRIRVWRGKHHTPVVLVSQHGCSVQPLKMVTRLMNYAYKGILKYPADGMYLFIDNLEISGARKLYQVYYNKWGCEHRSQLIEPVERERSWQLLKAFAYEDVEP